MTGVPTISREELEAACEDFSNIIGSSSDSMVFKGTLTNGTEIAVTSIRIPPTSWTPNTELYFRRKVIHWQDNMLGLWFLNCHLSCGMWRCVHVPLDAMSGLLLLCLKTILAGV